MNNVSIISYPSQRDESLLSLTELRSRYMIPFAGRFRVADFALRNASACQAKRTIIFSNVFDDLSFYVTHHPLCRNDETVSTKVFLETRFSLAQCAKLIFTKPTAYYIIYNGDCPSIIDFAPILSSLKAKKKGGAVLYMINYDGHPTMARTALVCDRKTLESVFNSAIKEKSHPPYIFEMIINRFIMKNVKRGTINAYCRPLSNIPDYYNSNFEAMRDREVSSLLFNDEYLKSGMNISDHTFLGQSANVSTSYISEGCNIHGTVTNSILFPGVQIAERAVISDSIILPYGRIGAYAKINRAVIDEFTDRAQQDFPCNISENSTIGSQTPGLKNSLFPKSLFDSITLVGKNCMLPQGLNLGGAGYIASGIGAAPFMTTKTIDDGISILNQVEDNDKE